MGKNLNLNVQLDSGGTINVSGNDLEDSDFQQLESTLSQISPKQADSLKQQIQQARQAG